MMMAIDTYVSVTIGNLAVGAGTKPGNDTKHATAGSVGDVTIGYDKTKVASLSRLREAVASALFQVQCGNTLTP